MEKKAAPKIVINVSNEMSREEETLVIQRLTEKIQELTPDSYLSQLLHYGLSNWIHQRIRDDASCDLWQEYQDSKQKILDMEEKISELELKNQMVAENLRAEAERGIQANLLLQASRDSLETVKQAYNELDNALIKERKKMADYAMERNQEQNEMEHHIEYLEKELSELKVKLFDIYKEQGRI